MLKGSCLLKKTSLNILQVQNYFLKVVSKDFCFVSGCLIYQRAKYLVLKGLESYGLSMGEFKQPAAREALGLACSNACQLQNCLLACQLTKTEVKVTARQSFKAEAVRTNMVRCCFGDGYQLACNCMCIYSNKRGPAMSQAGAIGVY